MAAHAVTGHPRFGPPPAVTGTISSPSDDGLPPLPLCLQLCPVVTLSADIRPRGVRAVIGPKTAVLPFESFEHFVAIIAGCPDPDNVNLDFIEHCSASSESCRLRASIGRMRDRFEEAFAGEPDAAAARNVVVTIDREKTYILHPGLRVRLLRSAAAISSSVVRREILARLLAMFPPEGQ